MPDLSTVAAQLVNATAAAAEQAPAAAEAVGNSLDPIGYGIAALSASLAVIGAAFGIAKVSAVANESIARQPEAAGKITGNLILTAAFIEGVALFGVVVGLLAVVLK